MEAGALKKMMLEAEDGRLLGGNRARKNLHPWKRCQGYGVSCQQHELSMTTETLESLISCVTC